MAIELVLLTVWLIIGMLGRYVLWYSTTKDLTVGELCAIICSAPAGVLVWVYYLFVHTADHSDIVLFKRSDIKKEKTKY